MSESPLPFLSIVIPTRDEVDYIGACLGSITDTDYPPQLFEVLVVDGQSSDGTREVVRELSGRDPRVRLLENPSRTVPHAMNIGIRAARGDLIVRMDAHAKYRRDYLTSLVTWMERLGADNVGGVVITGPAAETPQAKAVALVLSHPFGIGNSSFRVVQSGAPLEVDTVPFGCYRRELFARIGLYDELFIRNQDDELNARLKKAGGRIFLVPEIQIDYVARESVSKLACMMYQYGYFKPLVAIKLGRPATLRQLAPPVFAALALGTPFLFWLSKFFGILWGLSLAAHCGLNLAFSTALARRHGWSLMPYLLAGFFLAHLAYGAGYLRGLLDFGLLRLHLKRIGRDTSLSR